MARSREKTEAGLIDAVGQVLHSESARALGVNRVATEAGVDKVLIYRYFGGLAGLVDAWAERGEFWPTAQEILGDSGERSLSGVVKSYLLAILARPLSLELLAWELAADDHLARACGAVRERRLWEVLQMIEAHGAGGRDPEATAALLFAAADHLALQARRAGGFAGISLTTDEGWNRMEDAIDFLAR